jgi:hypothetical protein
MDLAGTEPDPHLHGDAVRSLDLVAILSDREGVTNAPETQNKGHGRRNSVPSALLPERFPGCRRLAVTAHLPSRAPRREEEASRAGVFQRCGEIACLPSWGQAAGALALANRSFRCRRSSQ